MNIQFTHAKVDARTGCISMDAKAVYDKEEGIIEKTTDMFSFENVTKIVGQETKRLYGINPYADMLEDDQKRECEFCGGTGEVITDVFDNDSHEYQSGVGSKKCICQLDLE